MKVYLYAVVLLALAGLAWYAHRQVWMAGYDARSAEYNAALADALIARQSAEREAQIAQAPILLQGRKDVTVIRGEAHETVRYITQVVRDSPRPDCVVDSRVVRKLQDQAASASAAADKL